MTATAQRDTTLVGPPPRLWAAQSRALALGAVALVTMAALVDRAVGTLLPSMLRELGSLDSFALVSAAPFTAFIVATVLAGWWGDRNGPLPVLWAGAGVFAAAQLLVGTSTGLGTMAVGRLLSGLAEGLLDVSLTLLVALVLDERLRPKMMALLAASWVLPSVLGPPLVGLVAEVLTWRVVFLGATVLAVPALAILLPALRTAQQARQRTAAAQLPPLRRVLPWALLAAAGLFALNEAPLLPGGRIAQVLALVVALLAVLSAASRLLPPGTLRRRRDDSGVGRVVLLRGTLFAAFMGVDAFLPLVLTMLHGFRPTQAGITLSITGVMWSVGSSLQSRLAAHPWMLLTSGFGLLSAGLALAVTLVTDTVPMWVGLGGWAFAGVGIGMTSSTLGVLTMRFSDTRSQGRNNAAAQLAGSMGSAAFFAAATIVIAVAGAADRMSLGVILAVGAALAGLGFGVACRLRTLVGQS
jgi:MFS family permease